MFPPTLLEKPDELILQEFSSGTLEVHVDGNPQLVVQLPPQSTTHKTLGVMIYKDVSGKLALPQFHENILRSVVTEHVLLVILCRS